MHLLGEQNISLVTHIVTKAITLKLLQKIFKLISHISQALCNQKRIADTDQLI